MYSESKKNQNYWMCLNTYTRESCEHWSITRTAVNYNHVNLTDGVLSDKVNLWVQDSSHEVFLRFEAEGYELINVGLMN